MRGQALPRTTASQVTPSKALEILSEMSLVPETEVPLAESEHTCMEEASTPPVLACELDRSFVSTRDTPVNLDDSIYALVPVAAASAAEENNTTLIDMLRVDTHDNTKNPILTCLSFSSRVIVFSHFLFG